MKLFAVLLISLVAVSASGQTPVQDRMNLQNLLEERAKNFSAYTSSIQKRSGIFRNKTKRDIEKSNEVLLAIVTLDNDIMDALHRSLSYKTFERATDNYSSRDCEMKLQQSMQVTDTLMKQLTALETGIRKRGDSAALYKTLFYLMLAVSAVLAVLLRRKKIRPA